MDIAGLVFFLDGGIAGLLVFGFIGNVSELPSLKDTYADIDVWYAVRTPWLNLGSTQTSMEAKGLHSSVYRIRPISISALHH